MKKGVRKRYVAFEVRGNMEKDEVIDFIKSVLDKILGLFSPLQVIDTKMVGKTGSLCYVLFIIREGTDLHRILAFMPLFKAERGFLIPLSTSGSIAALKQNLKVRYPGLIRG